MLRSEARLEELIEKMIQFSLEASGQFTLQIRPTNFRKLIELAINQVKTKAENRPVNLEINLGMDPCFVRVDQEKIQWVVMELVDNAIKFSPAGGNVKVGLEREDNFARFSVIDTGIGISPERLSEIFEPYHQLDSSSTRKYGGIGLGLALVKKILEAHGSNVNVTSDVGKGTFIQFQLPIIDVDHELD
jgi:signal transduction histidine kinase